MSNMTFNILVRRCSKVLANPNSHLRKGAKGDLSLFILLEIHLRYTTTGIATLIHPVLEIQDASRDSHDSHIIYWATWGLDRSLPVHMVFSLLKLKGTRKSACNIGGILISLTHILYLYDGQPIVVDKIIKRLLLGEMVLGQVLQYFVKLLKKIY